MRRFFPRRRFLHLFAIAAVLSVVYALISHYAGRPPPDIRSRRHNKMPGSELYQESDVGVHIRSNGHQAEYIDKKGVHVVVGKYVGDSLSKDPKLSAAELNSNDFHPMEGAGENGEPVLMKAVEEIRSKRLWHINKFNLLASDKVALNRSVPDVRKATCRVRDFRKGGALTLPDASVVIVFHNEAWSTLLRTVHSVINRSDRRDLKEVILVDDASNRTFLGEELERHIARLSVPTRVVRSKERVGLIRARLLGAEIAKGKVLLFLDAHCETTPGWLEPLLSRIAEERTAIVCPVIDIINDDTFAYTKSFSFHWGAFNWELHFRWFTMSKTLLEEHKKDWAAPFRTPVMAGGLFAVDREYFYELGSYDPEMDIWGGENLELSFRAWMCGGSVEISPCSHVGHIFRKSSPYTFPREGGVGAVLYKNLARVAMVWMDDMKDFYFAANPAAAKYAETENVTARVKLRDKLKCHTYQWYLDNVWPEHMFPTAPGRSIGKFKHDKSGTCLQKPYRGPSGGNQPSGSASMTDCLDDFYAPQLLVRTREGYLMGDESVCLDSPSAAKEVNEAAVRFQACAELDRQKWEVDEAAGRVVHVDSGKCLTRPDAGTSDAVTLTPCRLVG
jgi:polypeptide N-acetylgalactosaminyltransferase